MGVQIVPEEDEFKFDFDLLDPTKIIPESEVPVTKLGKMVLNRNVDNFFSETEQITFHLGHIVRGIGFTNDPLLQGRLFSYLDTQINRMNGANFMQIPINRPIVPVHNNQRDGYMQQNVFKGKVTYFPNGMQNNTPSMVDPQDGGYVEYPEEVQGPKRRGQPPSFFDFYSQPRLYWNSLTDAEKQQTVDGFRFEVGKSKSLDVRKRFIDQLNMIDNNLARRVAFGVGVPLPDKVVDNDGRSTIGISMSKYPKPDHIRTRTVAILTAPGTNTEEAKAMYEYLKNEGAYPEYIGVGLGDQDGLEVTNTYTTTSSVLFEAVYVPGGPEAIKTMMENTSLFPYEEPKVFVLDAFRHGKPIAASSDGFDILQWADVKTSTSSAAECKSELGVVVGPAGSCLNEEFKKALIEQRFWDRLPLDGDI